MGHVRTKWREEALRTNLLYTRKLGWGVGVVVCGINLLSRIAFSWENSKNINIETQKIWFYYV